MKARASFTAKQVQQLLRPVNPRRVRRDTGHAHLSQQDVTAHLIRVFGFGGFDTEVREAECLFEHNRGLTKEGKPSARWDVGYRALVRLTVRNPDGELVAVYENGATATGQNLTLGEAHDLAYKSAISYALKRCAINLGDQFGLSLYNKGQLDALVMQTLVMPAAEKESDEKPDVEDGVPEQVSDGEEPDARHIDDVDQTGEGGLGAALAERGES